MENRPQFHVYTGPMYSSKTSGLLYEVERLKYQHKQVIAFKPKVDLRYDENQIVSHLGLKLPATTVTTGDDILMHLGAENQDYRHVVVDELFMIPNSSDALIWLFRKGVSIYVSSLDLSYAGKPFKEVEKILPWATKIKKCTAVCTVCGEDAHYTYRKSNDDIEIVVGGSELYEARCFVHFPFIKQ